MASLFESHWQELDLLDAGAGDGALTAALIRRLCASHHKPSRMSVTAFEFDKALIESLHGTLLGCRLECEHAGIEFSATVLNEDFIASAVPMVRDELFVSCRPRLNAAIVNPPYRKIRSDSSTRLLLRSAGIETANLHLVHSRLAEDPEHLIHFNGERFLGPYPDVMPKAD